MHSTIHQTLRLLHEPVALLLGDEVPANALQFAPRKSGCVMTLFASVTRGNTAVFDRQSYGCWGGGTGLGFGNAYQRFPGGIDGIARYLATSKSPCPGPIDDLAIGTDYPTPAPGTTADDRALTDAASARAFIEGLPIREIPSRYLIMKPLREVDSTREQPTTVVFTVDAQRLAALSSLANRDNGGRDNVYVPFVTACQAIGILPWAEGDSSRPRAVVGLIRISPESPAKRCLGSETCTFAVPWSLYLKMERVAEQTSLRDDRPASY